MTRASLGRGVCITPHGREKKMEQKSIQFSSGDTFNCFIRCFSHTSPLFVFHHGGGHCALVWNSVIETILNCSTEINLLSFDARGHGNSHAKQESNMSLDQLSTDLVEVVQLAFPLVSQIVLVGHSLGGSVVVNVAFRKLLKNVIGVCVLDVVEGTAIDSLEHMQRFLSSRPSRFNSPEEAVTWSLKTSAVKNSESAKLSVPGMLKQIEVGNEKIIWTWRTNLDDTKQYWVDWFKDLSKKFLAVPWQVHANIVEKC